MSTLCSTRYVCTNLPYELVQDYAQFSAQSTIIAAYEPSILWNLKNAKLFCCELFKQVIVWKLQMSMCNLPCDGSGKTELVDPAQNHKVSSFTVLHRSSNDMPNLYQQITNYHIIWHSRKNLPNRPKIHPFHLTNTKVPSADLTEEDVSPSVLSWRGWCRTSKNPLVENHRNARIGQWLSVFFAVTQFSLWCKNPVDVA